jgi:hypothetical protein
MKNYVNTKIVSKSCVAEKYQIGIISTKMNNEVAKSIRLPQWIWDAITRDADAHLRSSNSQIIAILSTYYGKPVPENINRRVDEIDGKQPPEKPVKVPIRDKTKV